MKTKVFSVLAVGLILTMLFLAGPAQGFVMNLSLNNTSPTQGDKVTFTAQIEIPSGEQLPVEYLILELSGPESVSCQFNPDGTIISGCKGITITQSSNSNFGYGYNYGYSNQNYNWGYGYGYQSGNLEYTITVDTSNYQTGTYSTGLKAMINSIFSQAGPTLNIEAKQSSDGGGGGCLTTWECSDWSLCTDGEQFRTCEKKVQYCSASTQPELTQTCSQTEDLSYNEDGTIKLNDEQKDKTLNQTINETVQDFTTAVTGAVTGVLGKAGTLVVSVFITLIAGLSLIVFFLRKFR